VVGEVIIGSLVISYISNMVEMYQYIHMHDRKGTFTHRIYHKVEIDATLSFLTHKFVGLKVLTHHCDLAVEPSIKASLGASVSETNGSLG
jgi:hypothetical protein